MQTYLPLTVSLIFILYESVYFPVSFLKLFVFSFQNQKKNEQILILISLKYKVTRLKN